MFELHFRFEDQRLVHSAYVCDDSLTVADAVHDLVLDSPPNLPGEEAYSLIGLLHDGNMTQLEKLWLASLGPCIPVTRTSSLADKPDVTST